MYGKNQVAAIHGAKVMKKIDTTIIEEIDAEKILQAIKNADVFSEDVCSLKNSVVKAIIDLNLIYQHTNGIDAVDEFANVSFELERLYRFAYELEELLTIKY
ncbi:hypothetical protein FACS189434_09150 [Bacteroidia bacterium]|nr:hypothetical protein FACS189434_09150 [Bacteroidia bacterium]